MSLHTLFVAEGDRHLKPRNRLMKRVLFVVSCLILAFVLLPAIPDPGHAAQSERRFLLFLV